MGWNDNNGGKTPTQILFPKGLQVLTRATWESRSCGLRLPG